MARGTIIISLSALTLSSSLSSTLSSNDVSETKYDCLPLNVSRREGWLALPQVLGGLECSLLECRETTELSLSLNQCLPCSVVVTLCPGISDILTRQKWTEQSHHGRNNALINLI